MYKRFYLVFGIIGFALVVGWHIADEVGMSKKTRLLAAYFILGFIIAGSAVQLVRFLARQVAHRPDDSSTDPMTAGEPLDGAVQDNRQNDT
jgi:hypothetical protein